MAVANSAAQKKGAIKQGLKFVDSRPALTIQKRGIQVIQREVNFGTALGLINNVVTDRVNMATFFNGAQGDHTTAFTVFRAMFRNRLMNQPLANAFVILQNIEAEIMALPGAVNLADAPPFAQNIFNDELADVVNARGNVTAAAPTQVELEVYATALLSLRNVVPLSALEFGGVAHGEGHAQTQLNNLNNELGVGNPFNAARRQRLTHNATVLLDSNAVDMINHMPIDPIDQEIFPGLTNNLGNNAQRVANQHVQSIESAYPNIANALTPLQRGDLVQHVQNLL